MPAVNRRLFAFVAAVAVAFGALWPLVSAARPRAPEIPVFMCAQGGAQQHPGQPADSGDDFHCPLCIATTDAVPASVPANAVPPLPSPTPQVPVADSAPARFFYARPPPSRAPPHLP